MLDHFGYYIPSIKWLSEIGLVKGISNVDLLLGQMSSWHFLEAGFSNFTDVYLRLNSVLMVVYLIYILEKKALLHFLFFPVLLLFTQSPSPDLPAIIFSLIILNEILDGNKNANILFVLSIFVFAIKPTMIWVPIFCLLYSILILESKLKFLYFGSVLFLFFILKNLYTFGFPIFPVSLFDLNLSWKPNPELLKISSQTAIQKTYDMQYSIPQIHRFSTLDYIKNWLFLDGIKSIIHCSLIILISIFSIYTFKKNKKIIYFLWISILVKFILVLLFSAQYRFFIDVFFVVFFIIFYQTFSKRLILMTAVILTSFLF
ncbi:LIC_10190 family membrane protein [Halpernia sp. GG3]